MASSPGRSSELGERMTQEACEEVTSLQSSSQRKTPFSILQHSGFQVFSANCANCHGYMGKKYDLLLDKVYEQLELATWVADHFTIHPAHHHYKQFYYQEWDERDR